MNFTGFPVQWISTATKVQMTVAQTKSIIIYTDACPHDHGHAYEQNWPAMLLAVYA